MNTKNPHLEIVSSPLFKKLTSEMQQAVDISLYDYAEESASVSLSGAGISKSVKLTPRRDHLFGRVLIPEIKQTIEVNASVDGAAASLAGKYQLNPKKKWRIHILHFSHTDTGYTDLPSRVARNHGRFLKQILTYCRETDGYPKESQFRWTSETGYQFLNGWVRLNDAEKLEMIERINEGRIEVAPIYLAHTSELYDYEVLHRTLQQMTRFASEHGIKFTSGMNTDITGLPWGLVKVLAGHGIKYLTTAVNATRGRAPAIPRPVWWEANDGSRVLLYNADPKNAYIEGATMGFVEGVEKIADKLPRYLERYETEEFPYDVIGFRTAGQNADNAGPVRLVPDIIKNWNELWDFPKAISSTNGAFMADMDAHWGDVIPSTRKAWPDWWMDTFGTVARATAVCRTGHNDLWTGETLAAVADALGSQKRYPDEEIYDALENLTLGDEVDTCASEGVSDPDSLQSQGQLHEQHAFNYKGAITSKEVHHLGSESLFSVLSVDAETVQVFNSASWTRNSIVEVDLPRSYSEGKILELIDSEGVTVPLQKLRTEGLVQKYTFYADSIPPLGVKNYYVKFIESADSGSQAASQSMESVTLENDYYRISFHKTGTLKELFDKELGENLINNSAGYQFNELIYEETVGGRPPISFERMHGPKSERTVDLDFMDYAHWMFPARFPDRDTEFIRTHAEAAEILKYEQGKVFDEITFRSSFGFVSRADSTIRLYHRVKRVDLILDMDKAEVRDAEAVYIAFPFDMQDFQIEIDNAYSFLTPEAGQMPESSRDWYLAQRFIRLWNKDAQIIWSPLEAPLVQLGDIQTGRWLHNLEMKDATIVSWPMNNYWWTNIPASQGGWNYRFAYSLTSSSSSDNRFDAFRFGWEYHMPAEAHYSEKALAGQDLLDGLLVLSSSDVVLTAFKRAENKAGFVLRLYEIAGKAQTFELWWKGPALLAAKLIDGAENDLNSVVITGNRLTLEIQAEAILNIYLEIEGS